MKKAFTLVELVVAIAILAMMSGFAGVIFSVSVDSHRTALANAEIMHKLRAITDQLNRDFAGIRKDAPMAIQFRFDSARRDSIAFFATGDFQSIRQYWRNDSDGLAQRTVRGNIASIYYGLASEPNNILARKQKIFTSDPCLTDWPLMADADEFLRDSLAVWRVNVNDISFANWIAPPFINLDDLERDLPLYMIDGIDDFMIQIGIVEIIDSKTIIKWLPESVDDVFGFFYNIPTGIEPNNWSDESLNWPKALKFTFTLYDSKGIVKEGRTFTHIVYIDN